MIIVILITLALFCFGFVIPIVYLCGLLSPLLTMIISICVVVVSAPFARIGARKEIRRKKELSLMIKEARERKDFDMLAKHKAEYELIEYEILRKDVKIGEYVLLGLFFVFLIFMIVHNYNL